MTGEEILKKMNALLDVHLRLGCSIYQAGYKDDYFGLFLEAYRNRDFEASAQPRLTGDAIRDRFFGAGWMADADYDGTGPKAQLLNALLRMWDEWYYALTKIDAEV